MLTKSSLIYFARACRELPSIASADGELPRLRLPAPSDVNVSVTAASVMVKSEIQVATMPEQLSLQVMSRL